MGDSNVLVIVSFKWQMTNFFPFSDFFIFRLFETP
jgi:hypothetical protein